MSEARTVIVLAAGKGTRMKSSLPKVLMPMLGRTLLGHVLEAAHPLQADQTMVVIGHEAEKMKQHLAQVAPYAQTATQEQQLGTGHAVRVAMDSAPEASGTVVVLYGDTPLLRAETLSAFMSAHESSGNTATVLSAVVDDPTGLGRILRDSEGAVTGIVEHRDASADELAINEINSGMYAFDAASLRQTLGMLKGNNDQGEEYLTDVLGLLHQAGKRIGTFHAPEVEDTYGCNDRAQMADLQAIMQGRINTEVMRSGVTLDDPSSTWIDVTVRVEPDVTIRPGVQLRGDTVIGAHSEIGPDSTLIDTSVGAEASVTRAHCVSARIDDECQVGPFAYLRPGTVLAQRAKAGTYVELKNSLVEAGAKVPHLSYVGDTDIGPDANVGAGTIVANYDGVDKHRTKIGEAVFVGSNSVLIAPVSIADGSYVAAGSAIASDVEAGELAVARGRQHNASGWVSKRRSGTKTDRAARNAAKD
ncbi:MAG TPA: bifunctional UDP-N-acetylglucosamine diphosphorylase/glucosamine-1-phosphate N-acetyltransferase GlmU [Candidatus Stackebrandtia faecavium]|nr:bifunctional UDP-N-acetylglucosamine diphosphorylase/glucosamine-1-phosphate N-acetyltransferase GlmU [Candidatus Stackebrandtia faecavium]